MLGNPSWQQDQTKYKDVRLSDIELSVEAYSNIFTDIMIKNGFDMLKTGSGKIEVTKTDYINIFDKTRIRKMLQKDPTYKKITKELRNHIDNLEKLY